MREQYYPTIGITHLNNAGQEDFRKSLSADRVVLGCNVATNPETGEIYLAGRAVANSRGVYGVYCITLDQDWNMKDLDVRCMDYYHDPNLRMEAMWVHLIRKHMVSNCPMTIPGQRLL